MKPPFALARLVLLAFIFPLLAAAPRSHADTTNYVWAHANDGLWNEPTNWTPDQAPYGASNTVEISLAGDYTVTLNGGNFTIGGLALGAAAGGTQTFLMTIASSVPVLHVEGPSAITSHGHFDFRDGLLFVEDTLINHGTMDWTFDGAGASSWDGAGGVTIATNGVLNISSNVEFRTLTLLNEGHVNWTNSTFGMEAGAILNNLAGAVFDFQSDGSISGTDGSDGQLITNAGTFRKSCGTNITEIGILFSNSGTVDAQAGTLNFIAGGLFSDTSLFTGAGLVRLAGVLPAVTFTNNATVDAPNFELASGTFTGTNRFTGTVAWTGGTMLDGVTTIASSGVLNIRAASDVTLSHHSLTNACLVNWTNDTFYIGDGASFNNLAGAVFDVQANGEIGTFGSAPYLFNNAGAFRKSSGAGNTQVDATFTNSGTVDIRSGTISFTGGFTQTSGLTLLNGGALISSTPLAIQGGVLGGVGTVTADVVSSGQVNPGLSPGILDIAGDYTQTSAGVLNIELAGLTPGTNFDRLAISGNATLDGTLNVTLTNGFLPANGNSFQILSCAARSGTFSSLVLPPGISVTYSNTGVFLTMVVPTLLGPALSGTNFTFSFETAAGQSYTVERNDNLNTTNWITFTNIAGDGVLREIISSVANIPQRFFRVRLP